MLPPPAASSGEQSAGSDRRVQQSFEQNLTERSAEFEAQRIKAAQPPPLETISVREDQVDDVQVDQKPEKPVQKNVEQSQSRQIVKVVEQHDEEEHEDSDEYKAAGQRKKAGGKRKLPYDPYAHMYYDPYGFAAKGKGKMLPVKGDWADVYDDESDYWYRGWCRRCG